MKAFAINTVHIGRAPGEASPDGKVIKPAQVDVMIPGTVFEIDKAQFAELEAAGVVRAAKKADVVDYEERTGGAAKLV